MKSGEIVEPYRFKPFGSTTYYDRDTGEEKECTESTCPKAEREFLSCLIDVLEVLLRTILTFLSLLSIHTAIPAKGHDDIIANTGMYTARQEVLDTLTPSESAGKLINRAPFYWSGGLGTLIRKSADEIKKDFVWDFFVYTNSPATSQYDVANYASWLDSWRFSQLFPGDNFLDGGWSEDSYEEHAAVMNWALSTDSNGALNLRIPVSAFEYV